MKEQPTPHQKRRAILMIVAFTVFAAIAQPLFKTGANRLFANLTIAGVLTNFPLIIGLALYGCGSVLMILALRHGELSVLYPIISLSYVWVAILSVVIFHETDEAGQGRRYYYRYRRRGHSGQKRTQVTTPVSSMAWVMLGAVIGSLGGVGLKAGAQRVELNFRSFVTNWRLAAGLGMYLLSTVFFLLGLGKGELSVLYPMVSVGYVWTLLWSRLFFGEPITRSKIGGLALILAGVTLLGIGE